MLSKTAHLLSQQKAWSRLLTAVSHAKFSAAPAGDAAAKVDDKDLALKFETEWKKIYDERNTSQLQELEKELTPNQRKRVELLAQAMIELNMNELRYFSVTIRDRVFKTTGINPLKLNLDWPTIKMGEVPSWPTDKAKQEEALAQLWPTGQQGFAALFGGAAFGSGGAVGAGAGAAPAGEAAPAAAEKKEEKVEKTKFDIELAGIDATKKIAIIKEVREITKLGLKEAKELVEKTPATLMKDVKKEEAEKLKEKLAAIGCTVNLL